MTSGRPAGVVARLGSFVAAAIILLCGAVWAAGESTPRAEPVAWEPPDLGAPKVRTGAAKRGVGGLPTVLVLAPPELARTASTQPTLYWYLSGPSTAPVQLTVQELEAVEPLLEVELGAIEAGGVHATALADHGVRLEPGHSYEWSVALALNPEAPSEWPVAGTILAVAEPDPELLAKIEGAPAQAQAEALAGAGYWYELIDLIGREIAAGDDPEAWRRWRAALLDQGAVGLGEVAAHDRQAAGAQ